jgi:hypothetical protein
MASLQRGAADAERQLDRLRAVISAQAADTYVNGAGQASHPSLAPTTLMPPSTGCRR